MMRLHLYRLRLGRYLRYAVFDLKEAFSNVLQYASRAMRLFTRETPAAVRVAVIALFSVSSLLLATSFTFSRGGAIVIGSVGGLLLSYLLWTLSIVKAIRERQSDRLSRQPSLPKMSDIDFQRQSRLGFLEYLHVSYNVRTGFVRRREVIVNHTRSETSLFYHQLSIGTLRKESARAIRDLNLKVSTDLKGRRILPISLSAATEMPALKHELILLLVPPLEPGRKVAFDLEYTWPSLWEQFLNTNADRGSFNLGKPARKLVLEFIFPFSMRDVVFSPSPRLGTVKSELDYANDLFILRWEIDEAAPNHYDYTIELRSSSPS